MVNYNHALTNLHKTGDAPLTLASVLSIHATVMDGLLPVFQIGRLRQHPIVVNDPRTGETVFLPPDQQDVSVLMAELFEFIAAEQGKLDALLLAAIFHKQFVLIHPFIDGNGRTARLATKQLLAGMELDLFPLLSFENYYNRNITRYFQFVGERGNYYDVVADLDFTPWLEYFVGGILDELLRLQKQLAQATTLERRLQEHHQIILDYIAKHGLITDSDYAQLTKRAKATRALDLRKLVELGYIERHGRGRGTYYKLATAFN